MFAPIDEFSVQSIEGRLTLVCEGMTGGVAVEFTTGHAAYRLQQGHERLLRQALGLKQVPSPCVIDATAGFGADAFVMASLGCRVCLVERSDMLVRLLEDGMTRARPVLPDIIARMTLVHAEAETYLQQLTTFPDVVYVDPMYSQKKKSARSKKSMEYLQRLLPADAGDALLTAARRVATRRVVVKRPPHAPYLQNVAPDFSLEGKAVRFDIYLTAYY